VLLLLSCYTVTNSIQYTPSLCKVILDCIFLCNCNFIVMDKVWCFHFKHGFDLSYHVSFDMKHRNKHGH
jgi:hypothetical protein